MNLLEKFNKLFGIEGSKGLQLPRGIDNLSHIFPKLKEIWPAPAYALKQKTPEGVMGMRTHNSPVGYDNSF
jgi:hypothetical protein